MGYSDPVVVYLSFPKIISGHIGGAVQPGSESRQWRQIRWTARCKGASCQGVDARISTGPPTWTSLIKATTTALNR